MLLEICMVFKLETQLGEKSVENMQSLLTSLQPS